MLMRSSMQTSVGAAENLADDLHLLRLFCQIADYEVVGALGNERTLEPLCTSSQQSPTSEQSLSTTTTNVTHK